MSPDDYVAIDETLYPTRGSILFKTYNKNKPGRYGLNFRNLEFKKTLNFLYHSIYKETCWDDSQSHKRYRLIRATICGRL